MKDRLSLEKKYTLTNNMDIISNVKPLADTIKRETLSILVNNIKALSLEKYITLPENMLTLFDSSMQVDGVFIEFCKQHGIKIKSLIVDAASVLAYADKEVDPFILHGCFEITTPEFSFIKSTLIYPQQQNAEVSSSFVVLDKQHYEKYVALKELFIKYLKQVEGVLIKVIGGEDYLQDIDCAWDELFFGEKSELKDDLKNTLNTFYASKDIYKEKNIPWNMIIFVEGASGLGKTSLINTIISQYNVDPVTTNFFNCDDSVINVFIKATEDNSKNLVFIDNFDDFVDAQFATPEHLFDLLDNYKGNEGNVVLFTFKKIPDYLKEMLFTIDKVITIGPPDYEESLDNLFGKYLTQANIKDLQKKCKINDLTYGQIYKLYKLFGKQVLNSKKTKKKDVYNELSTIFDAIIKGDEDKSKSKKLGLLNKK